MRPSTAITRSALGLILLGAGMTAFLAPGSVAAARIHTPIIHVLSNRADLISGGDALVSVDLPSGTNPSAVHMRLNGRDVTSEFAKRPNGRYEGLVTNLRDGQNVLSARVPNGATHRITITNHPNGGPVLSGPQLQPWICQSTAVDAHCNERPSYSYVYYSTQGSVKPYEPAPRLAA
ncbi:MAG TPA: DUF6351 family protein [Solirubrobacteraceae bacterium]|nr:DUF6351 family protein [Solirubrobacteraceae bacterium]